MVQARALPYAGIDASWEEQQFAAFQQLQRAQGMPATSYADFVFGRLLEEDLHVSCKPMLPPCADQLHGVTLQGMCILQIVDVVNVGANFEHRKEDTKGPTRTLKICFTDGHQLVFGFEYRWLPSFSMTLLHGTKVAIVNADVRHGLLMLTPQNCRLIGLSGNELLEQASKNAFAMHETPTGVSSGAYSAALVTTQFTAAAATTPRGQQPSPPSPIRPQQQPVSFEHIGGQSRPSSANARIRPPPAPPVIQQPVNPSITAAAYAPLSAQLAHSNGQPTTTTPIHHQPNVARRPTPAYQDSPANVRNAVPPPVFVDVISSDEDCDSDKTDPAVQHLFYSPKTPRLPGDSTSENGKRPHKRPREATITTSTSSSVSIKATTSAMEMDVTNTVIENSEATEEAFSFALLGGTTNLAASPLLDPTTPFQYFSAHAPPLSAAENSSLDDVLHIRACIKSVAGFQFNTGLYLLKVIIEDCTKTKEVTVDAKFVEKLMGVSCLEFMRAMQKTPAVAHQWAARMQFALMTLEGVMTFRMNPNGTFTLLDCRDITTQDAYTLLQRVKASLSS